MVEAQAYEPLSVEQPSAAEQQALTALGARVARLLPSAVPGAGVPLARSGLEWQPEQLWAEEWACHATWSGWYLLMDEPAALGLLAAELGQAELAEHLMTELDLRLLGLSIRQLAHELARELQARGPAGEIAMAFHSPPQPPGPLMVWRTRVRHGTAEGEIVLAAPWPHLQRLLAPERDERTLQWDELAHAPVLVEATIAAPAITMRELLEMQPGDVLPLSGSDGLSVVHANGKPVARGRVGAKGPTFAISLEMPGNSPPMESAEER